MGRFSLLVAALALLLACGEFTGPEDPLRLEKVSGDEQEGVLEGSPTNVVELEEPPTIRVTRDGEPAGGVEIHWDLKISEERTAGGRELTFCGEIANVDGYVGIYPPSGGSLVVDSTGTSGRSSVTWSNQPTTGVSGERECELEVSIAEGFPRATFTATWREPSR